MAAFITSVEMLDLMNSMWTKNYVYIFTEAGQCNMQSTEHYVACVPKIALFIDSVKVHLSHLKL